MSEKRGLVTAGNLNVRMDPSTKRQAIGQMKKGTKVVILEAVDDWYKIRFETTGFIYSRFVDIQEDTWMLGGLSEKYETGGKGPGTVSGGVGDPGGVSYGCYQMTSRNGGTVKVFVSQMDFPWRDDFKNLVPGTTQFSAKWREIANSFPEDFRDAQHTFIKKTHFDPLAAKIRNDHEIDISLRSHALQDVIWSTAVQHGPKSNVVKKALKSLGSWRVDDREFDKKMICAIYAERGRKDSDGRLVYFKSSSPAVQKGVAARYVNEEKDALRMLEKE